ncbi:MAG: hypothetical protein V1647_05930 [Pseudomonadota bacterium]
MNLRSVCLCSALLLFLSSNIYAAANCYLMSKKDGSRIYVKKVSMVTAEKGRLLSYTTIQGKEKKDLNCGLAFEMINCVQNHPSFCLGCVNKALYIVITSDASEDEAEIKDIGNGMMVCMGQPKANKKLNIDVNILDQKIDRGTLSCTDAEGKPTDIPQWH